jgi:hypothetical protein
VLLGCTGARREGVLAGDYTYHYAVRNYHACTMAGHAFSVAIVRDLLALRMLTAKHALPGHVLDWSSTVNSLMQCCSCLNYVFSAMIVWL